MPMSMPAYLPGSCGAELAPPARCVSIDRVRKPWAMVVPKGVALARSGSTWMNWWSWVTSANPSIWAWVTSNHSPVPSSLPMSARNSSNAFAAASLMSPDPRQTSASAEPRLRAAPRGERLLAFEERVGRGAQLEEQVAEVGGLDAREVAGRPEGAERRLDRQGRLGGEDGRQLLCAREQVLGGCD